MHELATEVVPVTVFFDPPTTEVQTCEVFASLHRRESVDNIADGDGVHDGIRFPNGNAIPTGSDAHYFKPWTMSPVAEGYRITLPAQKCGDQHQRDQP